MPRLCATFTRPGLPAIKVLVGPTPDANFETSRQRACELRVEPFACIQTADFVEREVVDEPVRTGRPHLDLRCARWKDLGDVGRPLESVVVDANELVVARDAEILLDEVDALVDGETIRRRRVLGRRARCATVRD